jgi:hypothetical protein
MEFTGLAKIKKLINMYIDKDTAGSISIMDISHAELTDIGAILFEFEHANMLLSEQEKARLNMLSAKLRFKIIDTLNEK